MKSLFKAIFALILLCIWAVLCAGMVYAIYRAVYGKDIFSAIEWKEIGEKWDAGMVIGTPAEVLFFFGLIFSLLFFIFGCVVVLKIPYIKVITWPFRQVIEKRNIEMRRRQDAFPGLDKMISDLKAKQGTTGKISKSKMPPPVSTVMPSVIKAQANVKKEAPKPEPEASLDEALADSFKPTREEEKYYKPAPEIEIPKAKDLDEYNVRTPGPDENISTVEIDDETDIPTPEDLAEAKIVSRIDMKYETLMVAEKNDLEIVQDLKIGQDIVDFAVLSKGEVYLINFEPVGKEWVADEAGFDDEEPLWFSEAKYDVSPVYRLNRAAKYFDGVLQDIMENSPEKISVKKILLIGGATVLNYSDIKTSWDEVEVTSLRLSTGRPAEIPDFSAFMRSIAGNGSDSEEIQDMIYTAFVAVEP